MTFPENCAKMEPEELFADRPDVLRAYITGGDMEDEDIHTLPAHAARKGPIQYIAPLFFRVLQFSACASGGFCSEPPDL